MSATESYVMRLMELKQGDLGLLRSLAGRSLDTTTQGFDLFSGLWWPLRQKSQRAPRREVAWLIAKLFAFRPMPHEPDRTVARMMGLLKPNKVMEQARFQARFDRLLMLPLTGIEPDLRWALGHIAARHSGVDWVRLTDELSVWERDRTRLIWAKEYLNANERG